MGGPVVNSPGLHGGVGHGTQLAENAENGQNWANMRTHMAGANEVSARLRSNHVI